VRAKEPRRRVAKKGGVGRGRRGEKKINENPSAAITCMRTGAHRMERTACEEKKGGEWEGRVDGEASRRSAKKSATGTIP